MIHPPPPSPDARLRALHDAWRSLAVLDADLAWLGVWLGATPVRWRTSPPARPDWLVAYH